MLFKLPDCSTLATGAGLDGLFVWSEITTPVIANTYGSGRLNTYGNTASYSGSSTTYVTGGQPIVAGSHNQSFLVKMYHDSDPAGANAVPAKQILGPDWQKLVKKGNIGTC